MDLIATPDAKRVWFGCIARPFSFSAPGSGGYALLLVIGTDDISVDEQASLSEQFVRSGCRYAVCFGNGSNSWDDSIDMVGVLDEVDGRPSTPVMTTWHDDEPLADAVEFFAEHTSFEGWAAREFVVLILGGSPQLHAEVRDAVRRQFCQDLPNKPQQLTALRAAAERPIRQTRVSQVTAASLLSMLDVAAPGFRAYAESGCNLFDRDSVHGLFAACSHFVRERPPVPALWPAVADLVNRAVGGPDGDLDSAACTCFLENLASRDHPLDRLLRGQALAYWRRWCDGV